MLYFGETQIQRLTQSMTILFSLRGEEAAFQRDRWTEDSKQHYLLQCNTISENTQNIRYNPTIKASLLQLCAKSFTARDLLSFCVGRYKSSVKLTRAISSEQSKGKSYVNLTFDGVFFTFIFNEGGGGLILSTLFLFVKTIEKVSFLHGKIKSIFRGVPQTIPFVTPENVQLWL